MSKADDSPEGTIKVHFLDNTYHTLPLKSETLVEEVVQRLCKRLSVGGRALDPERHELFIIAPRSQAPRERRLLREDKPLLIKAKGGAAAFKFLFREVQPTVRPDGEGGEGEADVDGGAGFPHVVPVAETANQLRQGCLERQLENGSWHMGTVILDEDRLWFSRVPGSEEDASAMGSGMAALLLADCDKALESEDKRVLQLTTKRGLVTFRARSSGERNSWMLAIAKQAAHIKERDILLQADHIVSLMEFKHATKQLATLESFEALDSLLATRETQELFVEFVRAEHENSTTDGSWARSWKLEDLLTLLRDAGAAGRKESAASDAWPFLEGELFPRFLAQPEVQSRLCRIAAGVE